MNKRTVWKCQNSACGHEHVTVGCPVWQVDCPQCAGSVRAVRAVPSKVRGGRDLGLSLLMDAQARKIDRK